ncbi:MAG: hypothetical protein AB7P76_06485 [Candidatus Melainabacteria bacterium]
MSEENVVYHIDFSDVANPINSGVLRAFSVVTLALNIYKNETIDLYPYEQHEAGGIPVQILPDEMDDAQLLKHKEVFLQWVIGNALTELIEMFGIFLDCVYSKIVLVSKSTNSNGHQQLTTDDINTSEEETRKFEWDGLENKLKKLDKFSIKTDKLTHMKTWLIARHCLTHRAGIVGLGPSGKQDLNDGDSLTITWNFLTGYKLFENGIRERYVMGETGDFKLEMVGEEQSVSIPKGERINLHPVQFGQICVNVQAAAQDILASMYEYLASKGIHPVFTNEE